MRKRILAFFLAFAVSMPFGAQCFASDVLVAGGELSGNTVILHTNDSHSRVDDYMGFSAVSALKKDYEAKGAAVLLVDAGDTLHGLPIANLSYGSFVVRIINMAGYDAMTPGNHDFNYGYQKLLELEQEMDFKLLSSNCSYSDSGGMLFAANTIIQKNGLKLGVFGLSTEETAYKTNPNNLLGVEFLDPVDAAKEQVAALKSQGADYIIALSHVGMDVSSNPTSIDIAEAVPGIDIIIDGHSHTKLPEGCRVGNTLIASTGEYIQSIGAVVIDGDGNISAKLITPEDFSGRDPEIDAVIDSLEMEIESLFSEVVGETSVNLVGEREFVRTMETNLGNLTMDSFLWISGADAAMANGGSIRASIPAGYITRGDLNTVFPFGNYIVTIRAAGRQILAGLEEGVSVYPDSLAAFPQVAGITFKFDSSLEPGSRIYDAAIGGQPIYPDKEYILATSDYVAAGGDYTAFKGCEIVNEYGALDDNLVDYIKYMGVVGEKYAVAEGRITESENPALKESPAPQEYAVVSGDSLWKISGKVYGSGVLWPVIYELNKDIISNPSRIYIGQILKLPQMQQP